MNNEIGSEFWETDTIKKTGSWREPIGNKQFLVSGRTALYSIIQDIKATLDCESAYLPSYCCHTMIEPFHRLGIKVYFYPVVVNNGRLEVYIDPEVNVDIFYSMRYFGYEQRTLKPPEGVVVINDKTHSVFSKNDSEEEADYIYASFRKWGAIPGAAFACKKRGRFNMTPNKTYEEYINTRLKAMELKSQYMNGSSIVKQDYLTLFNDAETMLGNDYVGYNADESSVNMVKSLNKNDFISLRRRNADTLLQGLKKSNIVKPLFDELHEGDCPLFVPVIVEEGKRDSLRKFLIDHQIYCPVHWPVSEYHCLSGEEFFLYDHELSLICDQRYEISDMLKEIEIIERFERDYA